MTKEELAQRILLLCKKPITQQEGFELLFNTYSERLYWHLYRFIKKHDETEDLLQEVMVKVWNNLSAFRSDSSLYSWIYRIATNEALSFLEREKRRPGYRAEQQAIENDGGITYDGANAEEISAKLNEAISRLPEKQRIVFNLRYFEEMSYAEMAATLDTSQGALKASYHHAVKKIEEFIRSTD